MRKLWFAVVASVVFFLPVQAHAFCYGHPGPISPTFPSGDVCGTLMQRGFNGSSFYNKAASQSYVMICPAGTINTINCSTVVTSAYPDGYGGTVQAFYFPHYAQNSSGSNNYDFYAWGTAYNDYWGSQSRPIARMSIGGYPAGVGLEDIFLRMPPRPMDPTPLYPSGNAVGSSYTVIWKSGIDLDRSPYPATYAVWYKYWPFGGTEPANYTLSRANMPCHDDGSGPDAYGQCSTYVAGPQPAGNWKWYVAATLNVSSQSPAYYPYTTNLFGTASGGLYFVEP